MRGTPCVVPQSCERRCAGGRLARPVSLWELVGGLGVTLRWPVARQRAIDGAGAHVGNERRASDVSSTSESPAVPQLSRIPGARPGSSPARHHPLVVGFATDPSAIKRSPESLRRLPELYSLRCTTA